ncbi:hypothetical protein F3Y22_tig00110114pilonHSYRG00486 [Hibiscus syriacus]|uniref:TPX2 C-terminal domain-containing protein n=1 Tax=Hibiscus syriacus TaxID=106335 RepID=A0A6A3BIZ1_HIBSY|nr:hypothetical protein F3Y22_tig00110114pilonHSYRG00486 [Hibiscus syriacus]
MIFRYLTYLTQKNSEKDNAKLSTEHKSIKGVTKKVIEARPSSSKKIEPVACQTPNRLKQTVNSTKADVKSTAGSFHFKSGERAESIKEEKTEAEIKQLRKSLNFKAKPMPSFYHVATAPGSNVNKFKEACPHECISNLEVLTLALVDDGKCVVHNCRLHHLPRDQLKKDRNLQIQEWGQPEYNHHSPGKQIKSSFLLVGLKVNQTFIQFTLKTKFLAMEKAKWQGRGNSSQLIMVALSLFVSLNYHPSQHILARKTRFEASGFLFYQVRNYLKWQRIAFEDENIG